MAAAPPPAQPQVTDLVKSLLKSPPIIPFPVTGWLSHQPSTGKPSFSVIGLDVDSHPTRPLHAVLYLKGGDEVKNIKTRGLVFGSAWSTTHEWMEIEGMPVEFEFHFHTFGAPLVIGLWVLGSKAKTRTPEDLVGTIEIVNGQASWIGQSGVCTFFT